MKATVFVYASICLASYVSSPVDEAKSAINYVLEYYKLYRSATQTEKVQKEIHRFGEGDVKGNAEKISHIALLESLYTEIQKENVDLNTIHASFKERFPVFKSISERNKANIASKASEINQQGPSIIMLVWICNACMELQLANLDLILQHACKSTAAQHDFRDVQSQLQNPEHRKYLEQLYAESKPSWQKFIPLFVLGGIVSVAVIILVVLKNSGTKYTDS